MIAKRDDAIDSLADLVLDGGAVDADGPHTDAEGTAVRALAFTVWAFEAGRDVTLTQEIVESRAGVKVSVADLRRWRRDEQWTRGAGEVHQTLGVEARTVVNQMAPMGTIKAARAILDVMENGDYQSKLKAAMTWLDRFGHPIMVRGELFNGLEIGVSDIGDEQLEAQWLDYTPDAIAERHGDTSRIDDIRDTQLHAYVSR